jgi:hypothetical protein
LDFEQWLSNGDPSAQPLCYFGRNKPALIVDGISRTMSSANAYAPAHTPALRLTLLHIFREDAELHSIQAFHPYLLRKDPRMRFLQAFQSKCAIWAVSSTKTCTNCRN